MAWHDLRSKGLNNMPGVPIPVNYEIYDALRKLTAREREFRPAIEGLSHRYTIGGHTATGREFLFDNSQLKNLSLETVEQCNISWTTHQNVYKQAVDGGALSFAESLTDVAKATGAFWSNIAWNGTAFNLLMLRRVEAGNSKHWDDLARVFNRPGYDYLSPLRSALAQGRLYELDFTLFASLKPSLADGNKAMRLNPGTRTLLVREGAGILKPVLIAILNKSWLVYRPEDPAWMYALQAAKSSVTLYGIWLGHVYQWHMVTAAMQQTMYDTIPSSHAIFQLLQPQSNFLIGFNYVLMGDLRKFKDDVYLIGLVAGLVGLSAAAIVNSEIPVNLYGKIAPPSSIGDPDILFGLMDRFAAGREFWDDNPKTVLEKNGIRQADFSVNNPWDMYPVARHLILVWDICARFVTSYVEWAYRTDAAVNEDGALHNWMSAAADPNQGNIRGMPPTDNYGATAKLFLIGLLTSLIYRMTIHGVSRLVHTANPELSWVANFPPCLQRDDMPERGDHLTTKQLLSYLPNTGTIGEMLAFYFAFAFSKPYVSLIPGPGNDLDLYFGDHTIDYPPNKMLYNFRLEMLKFMIDEYKWWKKPNNNLDALQWPRNIET
jgi:hypothetical protein